VGVLVQRWPARPLPPSWIARCPARRPGCRRSSNPVELMRTRINRAGRGSARLRRVQSTLEADLWLYCPGCPAPHAGRPDSASNTSGPPSWCWPGSGTRCSKSAAASADLTDPGDRSFGRTAARAPVAVETPLCTLHRLDAIALLNPPPGLADRLTRSATTTVSTPSWPPPSVASPVVSLPFRLRLGGPLPVRGSFMGMAPRWIEPRRSPWPTLRTGPERAAPNDRQAPSVPPLGWPSPAPRHHRPPPSGRRDPCPVTGSVRSLAGKIA